MAESVLHSVYISDVDGPDTYTLTVEYGDQPIDWSCELYCSASQTNTHFELVQGTTLGQNVVVSRQQSGAGTTTDSGTVTVDAGTYTIGVFTSGRTNNPDRPWNAYGDVSFIPQAHARLELSSEETHVSGHVPSIYVQYPARIIGAKADTNTFAETASITSGTGTTTAGTKGSLAAEPKAPTITAQKSYEIQRSVNGGTWEHLAWVEGFAADDIDDFVIGSDYCYRIRRRYGARYSEWSTIECVTFSIISEHIEILNTLAANEASALSAGVTTVHNVNVEPDSAASITQAKISTIQATKTVSIDPAPGENAITPKTAEITSGTGSAVMVTTAKMYLTAQDPIARATETVTVFGGKTPLEMEASSPEITTTWTVEVESLSAVSQTSGKEPAVSVGTGSEVTPSEDSATIAGCTPQVTATWTASIQSTIAGTSVEGINPVVGTGTGKNIPAPVSGANVSAHNPEIFITKNVMITPGTTEASAVGDAPVVVSGTGNDVTVHAAVTESTGAPPMIETVIDTHVITRHATETTSSTARLRGTLHVNKGVA